MFFLPELIREKIDWYQWKSKMKTIIKEYHLHFRVYLRNKHEEYFYKHRAANYRVFCHDGPNIHNYIFPFNGYRYIENFSKPIRYLPFMIITGGITPIESSGIPLSDNYLHAKLYE